MSGILEALRFYADERRYALTEDGQAWKGSAVFEFVLDDGGRRAREALREFNIMNLPPWPHEGEA